jgi:5,10-methylenetetrahydromethanopterin reductase
MRRHILQVRSLLHGEAVEIDGGMAQFLASEGWLPERPMTVPLLLASQGPRGRQLAHEVADGLISLGAPAPGFEHCLVSINGTVLDDGEDVTSPRASAALAPLVAIAYHFMYSSDPESVKSLPNGAAWLASVEKVPAAVRHLSVHRGHILDISNGHDELVDVSMARQVTFTGTRDELRTRLDALEKDGATGVIFGTSGVDVEREMHAFAEVAGL